MSLNPHVNSLALNLRTGRRQWARWRSVFFLQSLLLAILALVTAIPSLMLWLDRSADFQGFAFAGLGTAAGALLCYLASLGYRQTLMPRQMFVATTLSWVLVSVFASLPLIFGSSHLGFTDAVFESISGITTTGSSIIKNIDHLSPALKVWRGLLQWIGGIGIIVMAIAVLPFLQVGGIRLFQTESSDTSDKLFPRSGKVAKSIAIVYLLLTCLYFLSYWLLGMSAFDASVHAMTTVSTGGFANYSNPFALYAEDPALMWASSLFMLAGAIPFALYVRFLRGAPLAPFKDQQVRGFLLLISCFVLLLTLNLYANSDRSFFNTLTHVMFNVVSVISTTGFASEDYTLWGGLAFTVFFYITFIGGCSGSTTGGIKIFRFQIAWETLKRQVIGLIHLRSVEIPRYNGREIRDDITRSVLTFCFLFFITAAVLAIALSALGLDPLTSITGAATALANVGPGLGPVIGPAGSFADLPDAAKWLLCLGMLLGRLEILTVLLLFFPAYWRG